MSLHKSIIWLGVFTSLMLVAAETRAQSGDSSKDRHPEPLAVLASMPRTIGDDARTIEQVNHPARPANDAQLEFVKSNYFQQDNFETGIQTSDSMKILAGVLTVKRLREMTHSQNKSLENQQRQETPSAQGRSLTPLVNQSAASGQSNRPLSIPARDRTTRPSGNDSGIASIMIDGQVRPVGFQEPGNAEREPGGASDASQDGSKQDPENDETDSPLVVDEFSVPGLKKKIQDQIDLVKSNDTLEENSRLEQLSQLANANALVQKAATLSSTIAIETKKKDDFKQDKVELEDQLAAEFKPEAPDVASDSEQLQLKLQEKVQSLQSKKSDRALVDTQLEKRDKRITELPGLRTLVQEQQKVIKEQMAAHKLRPDDLASSLILSAKELAAIKELTLIDVESTRQDQVGILLPLKRRLLNQEITKLEAEIAAWETAYDEKRKQEIVDQQRQARAAKDAAIKADHVLADLAIRNQELSQDRSDLTEKLKQCDERTAKTDARFKEIETSLANVQGKVSTFGKMTKEVGIELVELRPSLMHTFESQAQIEQIKKDQQEYRLKGLRLKAERESLSASDELVQALNEQRATTLLESTLTDEEFEAMAKELIKTQLNYLTVLEKDYQKYRKCLTKEQAQLVSLINKVREAFEYIDENALWVPSTNPISIADIGKSGQAMRSFFDGQRWGELGQHAKSRILRRPYESALAGFLMLAIVVVTRRLKGSA